MDLEDNNAVVYSDRGEIKDKLQYTEVNKLTQQISEFLLEYIKEKHLCLGLHMSHNILLPSIILSLRNLQHAFIFIPNQEEIPQNLGITWTLSFNSDTKTIAQIALKNRTLFLHKCGDNALFYDNIYYVVKTSGTTGESKYVKVSTHSIESNVKCLSEIFQITKNDVIYFGTPLTFDPSMVELLLALHNKATLLLSQQHNPNYLYETIFHPQNGATVLQIVPSVFLRWAQFDKVLVNKRLRILAFGGEAFPDSLLKYERSKSLRIFNLYGITEVSCWAMIHEVDGAKVSLGKPLADTLIQLRDDSGRVTQIEGEIFIGSENRVCLLMNEAFPEGLLFRPTGDIGVVKNGELFYKGRKNDTIKRFGHKVNLTKLEQMISLETGLSNKCVWLESRSKLLAFVVVDFDYKNKNKVIDKIRVKLLHSLPKHFFPDCIDLIRKCPVTAHGKTDKETLKQLYLNGNKPNGTTSDVLEALFCKYFSLSRIQLEDKANLSFFDLGGNSILAVQFLSEFKEQNGADCAELTRNLFVGSISLCLDSVRGLKISKRKMSPIPETQSKRVKNLFELKVAWSYSLEACVDATPLVFQDSGELFVAVGSFAHLFSVVRIDGTQVSKFLLPNVVESTACLSPCGDYLYVGCFDGCLYALDYKNGKIQWVYKTEERIKCQPKLCKNQKALVFGSYDKHMHCIAISNGSLFWKTSLGASVISSPLVHQEKIYVANISGTGFCLAPSGEILWQYKTTSPIFGSPCVLNGWVVWPNVNGNLIFLSSDGVKVQSYECGGHLYSSLIGYKDFIVFGCHDNNLYVLQMENDAVKPKLIVNLGEKLTTPAVWNDFLVVAGQSGHLFLVDFEGNLCGNLALQGQIFSSVVCQGNAVFVGCRDDNLYCVEIK